jgi:hypothetical protein
VLFSAACVYSVAPFQENAPSAPVFFEDADVMGFKTTEFDHESRESARMF